MKKLVFILLLFCSVQSFGQNRFPSIDSAKNYTLRYIRNSTLEAFSNYRMQNVAYGTLELIDSLAGAGVVDSIWKTSGGGVDTLKYRVAGLTVVVGTFSGGGGSTYTFSNGLKETAGTVKLGDALTENTTIQGNFFNLKALGMGEIDLSATSFDPTTSRLWLSPFSQFGSLTTSSGTIFSTLLVNSSYASIQASNSSPVRNTAIIAYPDSIYFETTLGRINFNNVERNNVDTTTLKPMAWDANTKRMKVLYGWPSSGGGVPYTLINGATNLGSGAQVFKDTSSNKINLRSVTATGGMVATQNTNDIAISLPSQSGNNGKYLKTDGTNASWQNASLTIDSGGIASRPVSPTFGQRYFQTNELAGWYNWNGRFWDFQKPYDMIFDFTFTVKAYNSSPGITLSSSGGGDWRSITAMFDGTNYSKFYVHQFAFYTAASTAKSGFRAGSASALSNFLRGVDSNFTFHTRVGANVISDATNAYTIYAGSNSSDGASDGNGAYFKYTHSNNSGQWQCITKTTGGTTTINTSVALTALEAYDLVIDYYGDDKIEFYINGVLVGQSTTHIDMRVYDTGVWIQRSAGTGAVYMAADRLKFYRW